MESMSLGWELVVREQQEEYETEREVQLQKQTRTTKKKVCKWASVQMLLGISILPVDDDTLYDLNLDK